MLDIFKIYKPNCIFNLAAETHVDRSIDGPKNFIDSNIYGVFSLLEACKKFLKIKKNFKLIHISTDEVYGDNPKGKSKETDSSFDISENTVSDLLKLCFKSSDSFSLIFKTLEMSFVTWFPPNGME